ncbi:AhpC/TSA family protein [Zhouia spongiae]|uniref:thioredoxin-dependent peroxiredoxin n=1 Tax=Zhouia spongiae TaxID=2202721 RepID=A0ABY3YLI7_9FLAO|nr:peroxiredoxin-like family protein [Zhouia spongiae]UNY98645.1 AhpC/TSA family protein [Zhouia spongiae]
MKNEIFIKVIAFVAFAIYTHNLPAQNIQYDKFGMESIDVPTGLNVGDLAPDVMMLLADGQKVALKDLYSKQPVVLIFYRGYWCPVCNRYLAKFAKDAHKIEELGAKIIAVTPQDYDNIDKTAEKNETNFTIVSDRDETIMKVFDVDYRVTDNYQQKVLKGLNTSIAGTNASNEAVLPVPATYIIDQSGKIVYKQFDPDYRNRASVDEILAHLPK